MVHAKQARMKLEKVKVGSAIVWSAMDSTSMAWRYGCPTGFDDRKNEVLLPAAGLLYVLCSFLIWPGF